MSPCADNRAAGRRRHLGRRGSVSVEFTLAAAGLITLLLAGLDLGRYFFTAQSLSYLVGEAARGGAVTVTAGCASGVATYAARAPMLKPAQLTLQLCTYPPKSTGNDTAFTRLDVTASYPFSFLLPLLCSRVSQVSESTSVLFTAS